MSQDKYEHAKQNAKGWYASICEMLEAIGEAEESGDNTAIEDCRRTIEESVLSVLVRDGWHAPGSPAEDGAEEFEILLTTGGPALRIWGTLDKYAQPNRCELQLQDWFIPWQSWAPEAYDEKFANNIRLFASFFYFGE